MTIKGTPIPTEGYTYFTIYRAHAIYHNPAAEKYTYAAGANGEISVFDVSFEKIRAQLDEITGATR
jgi:hypothetical protein